MRERFVKDSNVWAVRPEFFPEGVKDCERFDGCKSSKYKCFVNHSYLSNVSPPSADFWVFEVCDRAQGVVNDLFAMGHKVWPSNTGAHLSAPCRQVQ